MFLCHVLWVFSLFCGCDVVVCGLLCVCVKLSERVQGDECVFSFGLFVVFPVLERGHYCAGLLSSSLSFSSASRLSVVLQVTRI